MWVNKRRYNDLYDRVVELEKEVRKLRHCGGGVYVTDEGLLEPWDGPCLRFVDAVNVMARHLGFRWKQHRAEPVRVEVVPAGKDGETK